MPISHKELYHFGLVSRVNVLHFAMGFASIEIVKMLLDSGANPNAMAALGLDALMIASITGRVQNIKCWLDFLPDWDVNRRAKLYGSTVLHVAATFGRNKLDTVRVLVESGRVNVNCITYNGLSVLFNAAESDDASVDVVRYFLRLSLKCGINYQTKARTILWQTLFGLSRALYRLRVRSGIVTDLAMNSGLTPLHAAISNGDLEIVEYVLTDFCTHTHSLTRDIHTYIYIYISGFF